MCERIPQDNKLNPERVEDIVKAAIAYADEIPERAYHVKSKWPFLYVISLLVCGVGTLWNYTTAQHGGFNNICDFKRGIWSILLPLCSDKITKIL